MSIVELRRKLKDIGFKLKIKNYSFGRYAVFTDMNGIENPTIYTQESIEYWKPLNKFIEEREEELKELCKKDKLYGLT